jgi:hypothetical protein
VADATQTYADDPERFAVNDARDAYERLGILREPDDVARWRAARVEHLTHAPGRIDAVDRGFAVARALDADSAALETRVHAVEALVVAGDDEAERRRNAGELLEAVRAELRPKADLVTLLVDLDQSLHLQALQSAGARVFGVNHTWTCPMDALAPEFLPGLPEFDADEAGPGNIDELLAAVGEAYSTYRSHYNADSRIPARSVAASYVATVAEHVRSGGEVALVRSTDGTLVAFETVDPHTAVNEAIGRNAVGELAIGGVVPSARMRGAYETSLAYGIAKLRAGGCSDIIFACTADNFPVQATWARIGRFRLRRATLRFHWWLDE